MRTLFLTRRTERTVVALRGIVALLVLVHVLLEWRLLDRAQLLVPALVAAGAMVVAATAALLALALARGSRARLGIAGAVALVDALALVAVARMTIEIDPTASIAWAFVLWVPFSVAVRATPLQALVGSVAVAGLVLAATLTAVGPLTPVEPRWTAVGVPALLVLVAGLLTAMATIGHRRTGLAVERQLVDERDRIARLREADELKNTFLAAVSHELRSPLTSILGFALTLLDREELDAAQRERMLRTIVVEAEHLEDILANLLDLDRLTRGKTTLVPVEVDPARLVGGAVEHVQRRTDRDVQLELERGLRVVVDAAKVERIVENLVGNAVKYTPAHAAIVVAMQREGDGIRIRVDDAGPGIGAELRDAIFEPFRRGTSASGVPGTGIGLSLVDRFSRMHGGRAWVEERPGGGSRFQVYLPSTTEPRVTRVTIDADAAAAAFDHHGAASTAEVAVGEVPARP